MDNNSKALKSGFWYVFSNLLVRGMTVITTPIFTRLLTMKQVGEYSNFHSWLTIAVIVVTMRMDASLISAKFDFKDDLDRYIRSVISLTAVVTIVWAIIVNVFPSYFVEKFGFAQVYINYILVYCFFYAVANIFQINERYQYRYKTSVFISVLLSVSSAAMSILLTVLMEDRLAGRIIGSIIPVVIIGLALLFYFFRKERSVDPGNWPYTLRISIPYIPHLLSLQILNLVDRIMIERICGPADNALYTIAYTCGHVITLLMTAMNSAFSPWLGDKLHEGAMEEIKRITRYYTVLFLTLAIGMMLLAPELLLIMGPRSYQAARFVMPPVAMGCACQFLYTLYVNVEQYNKKTVPMAFVSVAAAVLNYSLNAVFIPKYGYNAAAYTTLVGYLFLLFAHMLLVKKLKLGDMYDHRFVLLLVAFLFLLTVGVSFLYSHTLLRYAVILAFFISFIVFVWVKKELVKRLLKTIVK